MAGRPRRTTQNPRYATPFDNYNEEPPLQTSSSTTTRSYSEPTTRQLLGTKTGGPSCHSYGGSSDDNSNSKPTASPSPSTTTDDLGYENPLRCLKESPRAHLRWVT
ncbi:UNVERIFIED_CONTAM: hypothetical protein Slati_4043700 [Sesamum latifolium]|uniref:Uncharacterized protein n=1 Tax=Sesamum latifolium TaxID=2727402 RepID=A0AAW2TSP5_9LAMI